MEMDVGNKKIWEKFRVKRGGNLPFRGWAGTRDTLAEVFAELNFKVGAEIGVRQGFFSKVICDANPGLKMHCIDPWAPYSRTSQARQDRYFGKAQRILSGHDVTFIKKKSMDAIIDFPNRFFDFVYIDGLHDFDSVVMDLIHWVPKVKRGGIVSGHDFKFNFNDGIIQAVEAYTRSHNINLWYITTEDDPPSFFWVNP